MQKIFRYIRLSLKKSFDNIRNEDFKHNLLQALPFWLASILTGIAAFAYAKIFEFGEHLMNKIINWHDWLIFVIAPIGFVGSWWLVKKFAPYAKGSGIPQVMAAIELADPKERWKLKYLLSYKIIFVKIISSFVLVLGGGAIGREGPTIQIAGAIFRFINRILPKWWPKISIKNMVLTGAAAGLSAAFNTPLGGIVFAVEELAKVHFSYFRTALFTAVIIAGLTAQFFAGSYLYLGFPQTYGTTIKILFPVILISLLCGFVSSRMSLIMLKINQFKRRFKHDGHQILFLLICSLILASLAYFVNREILGSGKDLIERVLFTDNKSEQWYMPIFRMIGPALSFTSGGAGGIFAPALSAGASFGAFISEILQLTKNETNVVILAGMVAFLTGITRAPFTSSILVLEMTDRHSLIFYLMVAGIVASFAASLVSKKSLYDVLKIIYMRELNEKTKRKKVKLSELGKKQRIDGE